MCIVVYINGSVKLHTQTSHTNFTHIKSYIKLHTNFFTHIFHTLNFTHIFHTLNFTHSTPHTSHIDFTLHTLNFTIHTLNFTLHTLNFTLHSLNFTLHKLNFTHTHSVHAYTSLINLSLTVTIQF